ncbi:MAG: sigma-70 family RNA polymerase sigma factor [Bdellovibrionales bacterium]|nr:sigma-70 family RNA polymerase sigma factor [Bdellovibrionales bacterium]
MNEKPRREAPVAGGTDEELMERYRTEGDEAAFATLYQRHAGRVYGYLSSRLPSRQDLDEVHQAVFMKFHQSRSLYDPKYPVLQWIYVIARTSVTDHLRRAGRSVPVIDDTTALDHAEAPPAERTPENEPDLDALENLSERERKAVEWRVLDELSYAEIAARLDQTETSVRQIVSRALKKVRLSLAAKGTAR